MKKKNPRGRPPHPSPDNVITGKVIHKGTNRPVVSGLIEAYDSDDPGSGLLGSGETDRSGAFTVTLGARQEDGERPKDREPPKESPVEKVELYVFDAKRTQLLSRSPVTVHPGDEKMIVEVDVDPKVKSVPLPDNIDGLRTALGFRLPDSLLRHFEESEIRTLADIRQKGGLVGNPAIPIPADDRDNPDVRVLDSLAALTLLPTDIRTNAALVSKGFHDVLDVASTTTASIEEALADASSSMPAARIRAIARDQAFVLHEMMFEENVRAAFGERGDLSKAFQDALPRTCGCSECQSAIGPISYLADLLDYTLRHVRNNGQDVTLTFLQDRFHQPFRDLPTNCATLKECVRRVRISIEILRKHLGNGAPTRYAEILEAAYRTLLEGIGTPFAEIRQSSRHGKPSDRDALMARLLLPATVTLDPQFFHATVVLDALFKDPNAPAGDPMEVSEKWLNDIFGLRDTTLGPLAAARSPLAGTPDRYPFLLLWQRRFLWDEWNAADYAAQSPTLDGRPFIDPDVIGLPDLKDVTSNPTPRALRADRTQWSVLDFLEDRQSWIDTTIGELRAALAGAAAGLQVRLTDLLQQLQSPTTSFPQVTSTGMEGLTFNVIRGLYDRQRGGASINDDLQRLKITASEIDGLGRVLHLAAAGDPILALEFDDFYSIIVGRLQRFGFHALWKYEERQMRVTIDLEPLTGLTLSPHHFQPRSNSALGADTEWRPRAWRNTQGDRRRWEEVLQARIDRAQNLVTVLQGSVDAAEMVALPEIRNLMLRLAQPAGVRLTESTKRLTDRYQIDFEEGACARTNRIAQATQTLQSLLFSLRNGLLDDPALTLDDDDFDSVWQWLGRFESWKAAVLVQLHPEIALRPTLRSARRQSPGFVEFISNLRNAGTVTPTTALAALAIYEQYFDDVCSLDDGVCVLAPAPGPASTELHHYLFARSASGRLYWCYFDLNDEQSHWRELDIPLLDETGDELKLFGAAYLTGRGGENHLYFFAKQAGADADRIVFARTNLRQSPEWSALTWTGGALKALPRPAGATEDARRFEFARVLTNRAPSEPITLSVWLSARDAYVRALNLSGLAWEDADFGSVPLVGAWRRFGAGAARDSTDFSCNTQQTGAQIPAQFILAGDFDRDGEDEIAIVPNRPGLTGNGIWVMKYNAATLTWRHLSPIAMHAFEADLDTGTTPPARFALAGDFDGDGYPEIAIAAYLRYASEIGNGDDACFWVRKFDPATATWNPLGRWPSPLPYGLAFGSTSWHVPRLEIRSAVVGDFDNDGRDEIAVAISPIKFVEFPLKYCSNAFMTFDLELGAGGDHVWKQLPDLLCDGKVDSPFDRANVSPYSRFALAGKFRGANGPTLLVVGKLKLDQQGSDEDRNLGNDFWVYRYDGASWVREGDLDCGDVAIAARFGATGDFDGDGVPEVAIAQESILPGATEFGFWIMKLDSTAAWNPLAELRYGDRLARYAVTGDFDGDGADEIAVITDDVWQSNVSVFDFTNGAWSRLASTNAGTLFAGVFPAGGLAPASVAARLVPGGTEDQLVALARPESDNTARAYSFAATLAGSWSSPCEKSEVKPALTVARPILAEPDIATARALNARVAAALGSLQRRSNRDYLDELLFLTQLELANRLREAGLYRDALDRCRVVFDYAAPPNQRIVAAKLLDVPSVSAPLYQEWLEDTLDPHAIAEVRRGAYLRYTLLLICRCLIDWADAEFARADDQSVAHARELYERALSLLDSPVLVQRTDQCTELLDVLTKTIGEGEAIYVWEPVFRQLKIVSSLAALEAAAEAISAISQSGLSLEKKVERSLKAARDAAKSKGHDVASGGTFDTLRKDASARLSAMTRMIAADSGRSSALIDLGNVGARVRDAAVDRGNATLKMRGRLTFIPAPVLSFCIPPNLAIERLRQHAELSLRKIRACKNIAGLDLCLGACCTGTGESLANGLQPMPYHYATLIERTKQLVELARQMESSMLQFISGAEQARYEELKARQDLDLTQAGVQLKQLQVLQAADAVTGATLQRDRAQLQASHFSELISNGWTVNEQLQVTNLGVAAAHQHAAAIFSWIGIWYGQSNVSTAIATSGAAWAHNSQFHGLLASLERRTQEWQFEMRLAQQDVSIGRQQVTIAQDQLSIANQEAAIASMQATHAQTVVDFLANKFLNADLYEWMADVLEGVYRFFLQQATQLARMAELQLSFERQEPLASIIKADYWERPSTDLTPDVGASSTGTNNVRGLTGSARLLRDVYELDQYAFTKNQRKQQLSETISLAQLDPFAFQAFRQTGRLPFATPMSLFDRRLPGHYVRLIKRVRTSVVALIPPTMGIRAMLSSIGPTRVTVGSDGFRTVTMRRAPQVVALTSPANATGLFDLDAQPELLVPFEGLGLDGHFVFELPRASNPFDFDAIADVLVTFDYTALYSAEYREEVVRGLDRSFRADRAFSFRQEFADAWYDLNNPEIIDDPAVPMTVSFKTRRLDFPPNVESLAIEQVLVQFLQRPQAQQTIDVEEFFLTTASGQAIPATAAQRAATSTPEGLFSTRRGAWSAFAGTSIEDDVTWTLMLPDALKARFKNQEITDILLVVSYRGLVEYAPSA